MPTQKLNFPVVFFRHKAPVPASDKNSSNILVSMGVEFKIKNIWEESPACLYVYLKRVRFSSFTTGINCCMSLRKAELFAMVEVCSARADTGEPPCLC